MAEEKSRKHVLWFNEIGVENVPVVGGKSASLGEMLRKTGVPVPDGFATTAEAYRYFMKYNGLEEKIADILSELKDPNDTKTLQNVGARIRKTIVEAKMPPEIESEIKKYYAQLEEEVKQKNPFVAVRSSATAEDLP
ncbi:MAG: PEP/pyruvate-binding domain-containing protein, partial [Thermoproteota archaeon]